MVARFARIVSLAMALALAGCSRVEAASDPLPSWRDGAAKHAILEFVRETTQADSAEYVAPAERIATFDNDGTLWVEYPVYAQMVFARDRLVAMVEQHPEWKNQPPYKSLLSADGEALSAMSMQDVEKIVAVTHSGMSEDAFLAHVKAWLATATHPRFGRPYTELVYQPMLELLRYLRANGYKTYIVTGGGQEFVRAFAERVYGVVPEQVVGTVGKVKYEYDGEGSPILIKLPEISFVDDQTGKPEGISRAIGRRPHAAAGNSTGDQQMLEYTEGRGARLMILIHHDDAEREYAYGAETKIGTFSDALMKEASERGWHVVSMKDDWERVFPFEK